LALLGKAYTYLRDEIQQGKALVSTEITQRTFLS